MIKTTQGGKILPRFFKRLAICFRWSWSWHGFWRGWINETIGIGLLVWRLLVDVVAIIAQIISVVIYPVWRLLVEPIKCGVVYTDQEVDMLRKCLDSDNAS